MKARETMKKTGGLHPSSSTTTDSKIFYEMQPQSRRHDANGKGGFRQRSVSNASPRGEYQNDPFSNEFAGPSSGSGSAGLGRSNTTGKSLAQSIKRRFGSLRRRKHEERVY